MRQHNSAGLIYYTFDSFVDAPGVIHGVSTRHGGVSPGPFRSLNLGLFAGDDPANVAENTRRWHEALRLDPAHTVTATQAQANQVAVVGARHRGRRIPKVDALLTNEPGVPLMLRFADCVPVLMFDPVHRAVGLVHAGWRGTVLKITSAAVRAMMRAFDTRPGDLIAGIGPSVGPCCYTVGEDVAVQVRASFQGNESLLSLRQGKIHFDLWDANAIQLRSLGVKRIEVAGLCTAHRTDEFYSWRAEGARTGRLAALIALTDGRTELVPGKRDG